ncbi:glycine-rich domain-containing protein [Chryseobacterium wangxinyae]|uniref:glycine-rich domain-containing protein n=1 Tax=Chryseobacterium sp. CY353 TaxID=2997334 RepID=UPI00226DAF29|nr:hypothetical protein [Chryseobacterium sp. CY353]MCY0969050.1 hypothetical protein [Chryseobacterium sp. CY353]
MKAKMIVQDENLWNRIQSFSLDQPNITFPFSKKLAKEENWTEEFTTKAIQEYKKFIYLCCILPNGASPSKFVDKVWHLHLVYTENYWEEFCPNILKQKLHHHPSGGGICESEKHEIWFQETIKNYEEIFKEKVPKEVWFPGKDLQKKRKSWLERFKFFSGFSGIFLLNSCAENGNSISLLLYIPILFFIVTFLAKIFGNDDSDNNRKGGDGSSGGSCSGNSSVCSSSCGSSCGSGCGGCGGGGD